MKRAARRSKRGKGLPGKRGGEGWEGGEVGGGGVGLGVTPAPWAGGAGCSLTPPPCWGFGPCASSLLHPSSATWRWGAVRATGMWARGPHPALRPEHGVGLGSLRREGIAQTLPSRNRAAGAASPCFVLEIQWPRSMEGRCWFHQVFCNERLKLEKLK